MAKKKTKKLTRKDLPKLIRKTIAKGVKLSKIEQVKTGLYRLEGTNPYQEFVEFVTSRGKTKGGILRLKKERFWSVWKENNVITEKIGVGTSKVIGSKSKTGALRILKRRVRL